MIFSCVCKEEKLRAVEESDKILLEIKKYNKKNRIVIWWQKGELRGTKKKKKEKNFKLWGWSEVLNFNPLP